MVEAGRGPPPRLGRIDVLFLCTGNICRSPAAEALLRDRLERAAISATVRSAGLLDGGQPASAHGVDLLNRRGIDLSAHRSRGMTADLLRDADLILAMAREHVREAVVAVPEVFPRTFTLKELVRRGEDIGPRSSEQTVERWLALVHAGRTPRDLLGSSTDDDVPDPIGRPRSAYERMIADLDGLIDRMIHLLWGAEALERAS